MSKEKKSKPEDVNDSINDRDELSYVEEPLIIVKNSIISDRRSCV